MGFKIKKIFLLISLILLQSCSGGKIGNFLESSFENVEEPIKKENTKNKLKNKIVSASTINKEKNKNTQELKIKKENTKNKMVNMPKVSIEKKDNIEKSIKKQDIKNNSKNKIVFNSEEKSKNNKRINQQKKSVQIRKFQPQSYKIIFILKDVDPKAPIENLSTILRNSDVNFEIEKIERFLDTKNKNIKKN